ncbi:MAG: tetratricopeptide repeat protein [Candidatus Krumholzibacteriota bacterium]|nr:tetratricopeptide repeat protein [Candidatus Krumholzibacteriota bacterium]
MRRIKVIKLRELKPALPWAGAVIGILVLSGSSLPVRADSPAKFISRGNGSFYKGDYEKAEEYYQRASVKLPESAVLAFNRGNVLYRQEDYTGAREFFEEATLKARDLVLEGKAWYNMGNCAFREGSRQVDSDLEKSLELYQEAVRFYATALGKYPELSDAAHNIEVARLVIKDLLDKIKRQQEQRQEQQKRMQELVDSLLTVMQRQEGAIQDSDRLAKEKNRQEKGWRDRSRKQQGKQEDIRESTAEIEKKLNELFQGQAPPPVQEASSHLDSSLVHQREAAGDLSQGKPERAGEDQRLSLEQMKKALGKITQGNKDKQNQQQGEQGQQEQPSPQPEQARTEQQAARNETAKGILEEEKDNKKKRKQQARGGYQKVDKDW